MNLPILTTPSAPAKSGVGLWRRARTDALARATLIIVVILTFSQACRYDFVNLDDNVTVSQNPLMNPPTLHSLKVWWTIAMLAVV